MEFATQAAEAVAPPAPAPEQLAPSLSAPSATPLAEIERAVAELGEHATAFARLAPREKAALLRAIVPRLLAVAPEQVALSCRAKGLDPEGALAGEEWLAGPVPVIENARRLAEALDDIAARGRPDLPAGRVDYWRDGRIEARIVPRGLRERALHAGVDARVLFAEGVRLGHVAERQAAFYRRQDPEGSVALVLGGGNVASIGPMDALHALFVEGRVALLKTSPVNAYLGPTLEHAFAPLIERGFLRIVHGGAEVGAHLAQHRGIGAVHLTGSAATHDLLVWGPPGPEREARKAANDPLLTKPITSELGNVSPVVVVPWLYGLDELWYQARAIASEVANNASFNCNAAKLLVLPRGWAQRDLLLSMIQRALASIAPRQAYHPGAVERHARLAGGRERVIRCSDSAPPGALPWTMVTDLEPSDGREPLFTTEAFCGVLGEVSLGSTDPAEFLAAATAFCNERLWGTLSCRIVVHPYHREDGEPARAIDDALFRLRYGAIAINQWPALAYALVVPPWGGHPSATLADVQSGIGFVHNTLMLGGVEKTIVSGPLVSPTKPAYFCDNRAMRRIGEGLAAFAAAPSWGKLGGLAVSSLRSLRG